MKKLLNTALSIILTVLLVFTVVWAQTGSYTTNNYFYLPEYGAYGTDEYDAYNAAMEVADNQIQSNKESIEAIEADYLVAADLTGYYTKLEIDAFGYISDLSGFDTDDLVEGSVNKYFPGFTSLLADYGFTDNSTEWDLAYGWGDHALEGYLTAETDPVFTASDVYSVTTADISNWDLAYGWGDHALEGYLTAETDPSFVDWSVSQAPTVIHADNYTDNDTTYTSSDFTHDDLTGYVANEHIDWTQDQGATDIHAGNYTDTDTTYTAGTGLDLTGTVFSLDASAFDLSDFPADPNDDRYLFWNDTTGAITWAEGSGSGVTTFVGLTDTPLNYTGYAGYFPKVNAGATALEFAELTEADISDFGSYLENVVEDTTPELGGTLVAGDNNITGIGRASFTQELDNGSKTTNFTIDFDADQKQKVTLTANTMTLTLDTTSVGVANYLLKIVNGGLATLTWAAETGSVYWPGGTEPTLTESGTDIVTFYFDGTNWYGMAGLDFK